MARKIRADEELRAASRHLLYEVAMLRGSADELARRAVYSEVVQFALLEAFLIHTRGLIHTFYPGGRIDDDDVLAADFFDAPGMWEQIRPAMPAPLVPVRDRVNGELAHLSYRRNTVSDSTWRYSEILAAIDSIFATFRNAVPRARLSIEWFR